MTDFKRDDKALMIVKVFPVPHATDHVLIRDGEGLRTFYAPESLTPVPSLEDVARTIFEGIPGNRARWSTAKPVDRMQGEHIAREVMRLFGVEVES